MVDTIDYLYFAGYALFTMGNGDLEPGGNWRILTVVVNATGIILLTLVVSYLISVISAVVQVRSFAGRVASLGATPQDILLAAIADGDAQPLEQAFSSLAVDVEAISQRHQAYPVLRFYHSIQPRDAAPVAVALLADVMLLAQALPAQQRPRRLALAAVSGAIERYSEILGQDAPAVPTPGTPAIDLLEAAGVTIDGEVLAARATELAPTRARLRSVVLSLGWSWPD